MADEKVTAEGTPQEKESVTSVTDEALSSAYDATPEEQTETTETQETETKEIETQEEETQEQETENQENAIPDEPTDNAERSRLGRRMKSIEEQNKKLLEKVESLTGGKKPEQTAVPENVTYDDSFIQSQIDLAVEKGIIPSTIVTPLDQVKVNNFVNGLQEKIGSQYATNYLGVLNSSDLKGQTPDDIHAEVVTELQRYESPFNQRRYNNPLLDAKMNYLEAKESILMKRLSSGKPVNNFKGKPKDAPATGTSVSTKMAVTATELPALDETSLDFIRRSGMSEESVREALKAPMPIHLRGR